MKKSVKTQELFDCKCEYIMPLFEKCEYPWEMLSKIGEHIDSLVLGGMEGFVEVKEGVFAGEGVEIAKTATIEPPAILGKGTKVRPGAYLRGNVITGSNCVIGNSTEIKNSILLDNVQVPHYNYVGDSVLGNFAHMGAGAICSNLKADKKPVVIKGEESYQTGLKKIGGILADGADVGCGCILNPGTVIGKKTSVYPLVRLRGVYPNGAIVKDSNNIVERI